MICTVLLYTLSKKLSCYLLSPYSAENFISHTARFFLVFLASKLSFEKVIFFEALKFHFFSFPAYIHIRNTTNIYFALCILIINIPLTVMYFHINIAHNIISSWHLIILLILYKLLVNYYVHSKIFSFFSVISTNPVSPNSF